MNTFISMLLSIIGNIFSDSTNKGIAVQLLYSYNNIQELTAGELAKRCFCNTNMISRFCKNLGFRSFSDMKSFIVSSHAARMEQMKYHLSMTDEKKVIDTICHLSEEKIDIKQFVNKIDVFNGLVYEAPQVVIIGALYPEVLSYHYLEDMIELGKCAYALPVAKEIEIPSVNNQSMIILVTFTGRMINNCRNTVNAICGKYSNTVLMTGNINMVSDEFIQVFHLPLKGDDENNNLLFIEILRLMKYRYYKNYIEGR